MDVLTAAFHLVHDGPGGSGAIAQFLGKARGTLDHEVNPPQGSSAKLGLLDAVKISKLRRDWRVLHAFADECGHACFPRPDAWGGGDATTQDVLFRATELAREIAETFGEVNASLSDGTVTPNELEQVERECMETITALTAVARAMREKMESDQAHARRSRGVRAVG